MAGERPRRPARINPRLWSLIQSCWEQDPLERPAMSVVVRQLTEIRAMLVAELEEERGGKGVGGCCCSQ